MNYTTNYHLPQWVESDRILMEDFNQALEAIDTGVAAAKTAAESAQSAAAVKPYAVGTYAGNGTTRTITVGFKPSLVIIYQQVGADTAGELGGDHFMVCDGRVYADKVSFTSTGFTVSIDEEIPYPRVNGKPFSYLYIAFK